MKILKKFALLAFGLQQLWNNIYFPSTFALVRTGFGGTAAHDNASYTNTEGITASTNDFILFKT